MNKTALVTGSSGFLGCHVVPALKQLEYDVTCIDPLNTSYFRGTFEQWQRQCGPRLPTFDVVIHLAATLTKSNIADRNTQGIIAYLDLTTDFRMAQYLESHPPRQRAVWMSSCAVEAQEHENYSFVKYVGERFAHNLAQHGVPITILRPYAGYGPGQSVEYPFSAILSRAMRKDDPLVVWGSLSTARDWIFVDDLVEVIISAAQGEMGIGPHEVGTGRCTTFGELARMMANAVGYSPQIVADSDKPVGGPHRVCSFLRPVKVPLEEGIQRCLEAARATQLQQG